MSLYGLPRPRRGFSTAALYSHKVTITLPDGEVITRNLTCADVEHAIAWGWDRDPEAVDVQAVRTQCEVL